MGSFALVGTSKAQQKKQLVRSFHKCQQWVQAHSWYLLRNSWFFVLILVMGINSVVLMWVQHPSRAKAEYKVEQHKLVINFNVAALFKGPCIENSSLERGKELLTPKPGLCSAFSVVPLPSLTKARPWLHGIPTEHDQIVQDFSLLPRFRELQAHFLGVTQLDSEHS